MFEGTRNYELLFLLNGSAAPDEIAKNKELVKSLVSKESEEIINEEDLGKRRLAYQIAGQRFGFYGLIQFKSNPKKAKELDKQLQLEDALLRHIIVKLERPPEPRRGSPRETVKPKIMEQTSTLFTKKEEVDIQGAKSKELPDLDELDKKLDEILKGEKTF